MAIDIPGIAITIKVGAVLPSLDKGVISYKHLARWCAAQQNWDQVHYNQDYARKVAGLKDVYVNGAIKAQALVQFLSDSFARLGWVWRMDTDFRGVDYAQEHLVIHGTIAKVTHAPPYVAVHVDYRITNLDQAADTTTGQAIVLLDPAGAQLVEIDDSHLPDEWRVNTQIGRASENVPANIRAMVGASLDDIESVVAVDLSRLRLMADAVTKVSPWPYDAQKAALNAFGAVVAMPLFPLHGLEAWPDSKPFDPDHQALGREGVTDVGRLDPKRLGLLPGGIFNGGNFVEIHSLARIGETIAARSVLAGAELTSTHPASPAICIDTLNHYRTTRGRKLITERQTLVYALASS
jgi:hypothetical protein